MSFLSFIDNLIPWFGTMVELGGDIVLVIQLMALILWALLLERVAYLNLTYPVQRAQALRLWQSRSDHSSWFARQYRQLLVAQVTRNLKRNVPMLHTIIAVCPLLGLLGTVVGMLEVFESIAITGTNSPRSTASGVSKATITTLAGMVVAISGLMLAAWLGRRAEEESGRLSRMLQIETGLKDRGGGE